MGGADVEYVCIGVKASNYFMPKETLSDKGPGGGGWIHFNKYMQVTKKDGELGDASCPEDFLPRRGAGLARGREHQEDVQGEDGPAAHLVALGRRHVRHQLGPARRLLRLGG